MKKSNKKQKLNLKSSVLLLLLIAVLLISSTYAWFTANQTVTVDAITVNVQASNGLQISTDASAWKAAITNADITGAQTNYVTARNCLPSELVPTSSAGTVTSGDLNMFLGEISADAEGNYVIKSTKLTDANGTTGNYVVFDLFFKVNTASQLKITTASKILPGDTANDVGLQNAARIGFINEGNKPEATTVSTLQTMNAGDTAMIWEPNYDWHTEKAVAWASSMYNKTCTAETAGQGALSYYGISSAFETTPMRQLATTNPDAAKFGAVTPTFSTVKDFATNFDFISLSAGVTKVRTYLWIEGQDVDCQNGASGTSMIYNLQFTIA